jgi:hypothetical protein
VSFQCPNGHDFPRAVAVPCEHCGAHVACEPVAAGKVYFDLAVEVRMYAERMLRDSDEAVRRCGADVIGLLDAGGA